MLQGSAPPGCKYIALRYMIAIFYRYVNTFFFPLLLFDTRKKKLTMLLTNKDQYAGRSSQRGSCRQTGPVVAGRRCPDFLLTLVGAQRDNPMWRSANPCAAPLALPTSHGESKSGFADHPQGAAWGRSAMGVGTSRRAPTGTETDCGDPRAGMRKPRKPPQDHGWAMDGVPTNDILHLPTV